MDGFLYSASAVSLRVITAIRKKNQIIYTRYKLAALRSYLYLATFFSI
jgi:hypothetical protein